MASRRLLKKQVKGFTQLTASMCIMAAQHAKENNEAFIDLMYKTFELREDIVSRISHTEPGNVKAFYKKLTDDLTKGLNDIVTKLYELEA